MPLAVVLPALLLAALIATGRQAAADELLLNGDFSRHEEGWRALGDLLFDTGCDGNAADPAGRLQLSDGSGWLVSDAVAIEPGEFYEAIAHAYFAAGADQSSKLRLSLLFYQTADGTGAHLEIKYSESIAPAAIGYISLTTGLHTAPGRAHSARLRVNLSALGPTTACLDDLSLAGPAPSSTETPSPTVPAAPATVTPTPTVPAASPTPSPFPSPTVAPTATATAVPMPSESILNGGFEKGAGDVPDAWRKFGGILSRTKSFRRSGSFAGAFSSSTTSTKWIYQPLSVQGGRSYTFRGFVLNDSLPDSTVFLRISWYSSPDASGSSLATSDSPESLAGGDPSFHYLSTGSVTAPQNARSARARILLVPASAAPETVFLDDFTFEETAAPTPTPGGDGDEMTPSPEAQPAAANGPEPPSGPSAGDRPASSGGVRQPGQTSGAPSLEDSPYPVRISEVLPDAGRGRDDAAHEWIELYNAGSESVELGGWSLVDNVARDTMPPLVLRPGDYAVVAASPDFRRDYPAFHGNLLVLADGRLGNGLANKGDRLLLLDEEGRRLDAFSYGSDREFFEPSAPAVPPGHSLERFPAGWDTDTAADFRDNAHPSPGTGPTAGLTPTATAASALSEVHSRALSPTRSSGSSWPWLLLSVGLTFVGGTGTGVAGVLFWRVRRHRS